jgi:RNA-directed DNA polymerase
MSFTTWDTIDWFLIRKRVSRYQVRIFKAAKNKEKYKVRILQKRLLGSLDAKLLAVHRITTENKGKNTPGVDKKLYDRPELKVKLLQNLRLDGIACPIRRVYIPKPGKRESRPFGIPIMEDRAKQALCFMALEPEWESRFEPNSYGFRKGRSCHDAMEAIFSALGNKSRKPRSHKYVLDADIKSCFDRIDQQYLLTKLDTLPEIHQQVKAWLKAGMMEGYANSSRDYMGLTNELGTPQGGVISPLLANIALHGLEDHLKSWIITKPNPYPSSSSRGSYVKQTALSCIRYADDFVVIHPSQQVISEAKEVCRTWLLTNPKLSLSEEKTKIVDSSNGFDFLGFKVITIIRGNKERVKIYPQSEAQSRLLDKIRQILQKNKSSSAYNLINLLRPIIIGWGNYYRYSECKTVFNKLSYFIHEQIRAWVFRRDRRNSRTEIKSRYFPEGRTYSFDKRNYANNWILNGKTKSSKSSKSVTLENYLPRLDWIESSKWTKVKADKSVYDGDNVYWANRTTKYGNWSTRERTLIKS